MMHAVRCLCLCLVMLVTHVSSTFSIASPYLETYPAGDQLNGTTRPIHFALILSFPVAQFVTHGAVAAVRVALDRINRDPYLLQNYTLRYTLTSSSVSHSACH